MSKGTGESMPVEPSAELVEQMAARLDARAVGGPSRFEVSGDPEIMAEAEVLMRVADLLAEQAMGAPALEQDPVAAALGLVPDPLFALDPAKFAAARRRADLAPSRLAQLLASRGWEVTEREVFGWTKRAEQVPPALLRAIADVLGVAPEGLTGASQAAWADTVRAVRASPKFEVLAERWALARGVPLDMARSALAARLVQPVFRGPDPTQDHLMASLEVLVQSIEEGSR